MALLIGTNSKINILKTNKKMKLTKVQYSLIGLRTQYEKKNKTTKAITGMISFV